METAQERALRTERFRQNQELLRRYNSEDGPLKDHIITAVQPVFLSSLVDQSTGFGQVSELAMLQNLFNSYGEIEETDL